MEANVDMMFRQSRVVVDVQDQEYSARTPLEDRDPSPS